MGKAASLANIGSIADSSLGFRNRIINGDMRIAQRGTSFAGLANGSSGTYTLDRWVWDESGTSTAVQTVSQDSSAPAGFVNSLKVLTTTAQALLAATNSYRVSQNIEGNNVSDLGWGTADAKAVTLSFWVRSSLTGTFGGSVANSAFNRSYPFAYTISAANTWEYKTVTIAGDTSGTWATDNSTGIAVLFSIGTGTDYIAAPGSWNSTRVDAPTGQVNVAGTLNATWFITGVQLEKGSTATSFDYRPYGTELALCQRYLPAFIGDANHWSGQAFTTTGTVVPITFPVTARVAPTGISVSSASHFKLLNAGGSGFTTTSANFGQAGVSSAYVNFNIASGLVAGNATTAYAASASALLLFTGCEL
jgi:hypothetical protein